MVAARENYFLVNLLHIKAIVKKDMVMVFDTSNQDAAKKLGLFMYDLESKLTTKIIHGASSAGQPYEFRALESILINVMSSLETDLQVHLSRCGAILSALEDQIDREKLRDLLVYSKSLSNFNQRSQLIRDVLDELLDNDDDLEMMYLTSQINPKAKSSESEVTVTGESKSVTENRELDTADLEMLLEAYYKQGDECVQKAETLINDIKSTEEIVNIILDANRNSLMVYELKITIYTLGFTVATALPAFYGMNLKNYIEESNYGFGGVVACSILCAAAITVLNFSRLRSVQKLTMMVPGTPHKQFKAERDLMTKKAPGQTLPQPRDHHRWRFSLWKRLSRHSLGYMRRMWYMKRRNGYADPKQRDMIWRWLVKEPNDK
ncbi:unnamed protein product [Kuraishia capsulata CBS 1993]|uniref:Magnesium transporter n=1 Tax=Kuraishia capsulata CBS 1993 TaxID=1382522 RepID=W6MUN0_9ASCO|nr:uncharacterized protein KUCA_T00005405001 [Kuraishia capsulata CBS 1993]CDK29417.1 unnamed protein product [Kuraishia capsulata CBS 1993]